MLDIGTILRHYKREDIRTEMVRSAENREVAVKYGDAGFGKRPDALTYPKDILEFAKQGASSFHVSEEHWSKVHQLSPELKREELDELRIGWDLVLDIDIKDWELSKIISWLVIKSLREHAISSISCKFSGNKGFHIGVPMKAFPSKVHNTSINKWFPDGPRRIAYYLLEYITENHIKVQGSDKVQFGGQLSFSAEELEKRLGKPSDEIWMTVCGQCANPIDKVKDAYLFDFLCPNCEFHTVGSENFRNCEKCGSIMTKKIKAKKESLCSKCGSNTTLRKFDLNSIVELDTLLISSRHMYRMVYSLHEKSGLCSIPIGPEQILSFDKGFADPRQATVSRFRFLDDSDTLMGEATQLVLRAFDFSPAEEEEEKKDMTREFETLTSAVPSDFFPPCINNILSGLEDGKKRSMFVLINFLSNTGYEFDKIDEILTEWNKKNKEPLREVLIKGQVRYRRVQKSKVLPPNCDNKAYYLDFRVCTPDNFCSRIKNPVNYAILRAKMAQPREKGKREKLTEEQRAMRRKFREKQQ